MENKFSPRHGTFLWKLTLRTAHGSTLEGVTIDSWPLPKLHIVMISKTSDPGQDAQSQVEISIW